MILLLEDFKLMKKVMLNCYKKFLQLEFGQLLMIKINKNYVAILIRKDNRLSVHYLVLKEIETIKNIL